MRIQVEKQASFTPFGAQANEKLIFVGMNTSKVHREQSGLFSKVANDLVYRQSIFKDFIHREFSLDAFESQFDDKAKDFGTNKREVLQEVLRDQYANISDASIQQEQIDALGKENVFTVTTGHQLSLFTGPLYFILKIAHVINLSKKLNEKYADKKVIPVFWMATEDHDFAEVQSCNLFKKVTWESGQEGAVGRMTLQNWSELIETLRGFFANHPEGEIQQVIDAYNGSNYAEATRNLVHTLFKNEGLLILDADDARLKKQMRFVFEDELKNQGAKSAVEATNDRLEKAGYGDQAYARPINFFRLSAGKRERLMLEGDDIRIDGEDAHKADYWLAEFDKDPAQFSPNVILRPLYQEIILPNLCYVGGGGEMAYWLQLKGVFDLHQVQFPLLQVRLSMMVLDSNVSGKMEQLNWEINDLFKPIHEQKKQYALDHADEELDFSAMKTHLASLQKAGEEIVNAVNPNMASFWGAESKRIEKVIDGFEQKMIKSEKSKHEKALKAMDFIHDRLFPNQGLQERYMNFFQLCANGEVESNLREILEAVDPFEKDLVILHQS